MQKCDREKKKHSDARRKNEAEQKKLNTRMLFRYSVERKVADATHASPKKY